MFTLHERPSRDAAGDEARSPEEQVIDDGIDGDAPNAFSSSATEAPWKRKGTGPDAPDGTECRNVNMAWNDV